MVFHSSSPFSAAVSMTRTPFFIPTSLPVIMMSTATTATRSFANVKSNKLMWLLATYNTRNAIAKDLPLA